MLTQDEEHTRYGGYIADLGTTHGLAILNGIQRFPTSSGLTYFPHKHRDKEGGSTVDYVLAQPSFIAVDHALLTFIVSFQFSTTRRTQTSTHTRYIFTSAEIDSVYIDGIYKRLCRAEPGIPLEELTHILTETPQGAAAVAYPHTEPGQRQCSGRMP